MWRLQTPYFVGSTPTACTIFKEKIMITYKKEMIEQEVAKNITCDVCKKEYTMASDWEEVQEFQSIMVVGGYGSVFGDGTKWKIDICQHCIKNMLGKYMIEIKDEVPF
jgi:hypothetical protein